MEGLTDELLKEHFELYRGYVNQTNLINQKLSDLLNSSKMSAYEYSALKKAYAFEFNGMKLHELYFENISNEFIKEDNGYISLNINNISCLGHHSLIRWKNNFHLEIFGKKGFVTLNSLPKWGFQLLTIGERKYPSGKPKLNFIYFKNKDLSWKKELQHFFKLINNRNYSLNKEGYDTMKIIDKCEISSAN
jgi:superoxide dismutase